MLRDKTFRFSNSEKERERERDEKTRIMSVDKDSKDMEITQKDVEFLRCVTKDVIEGKVSFFFFFKRPKLRRRLTRSSRRSRNGYNIEFANL